MKVDSRRSANRPTDDARGLYSDRSFWGLSLTQFLGAFNDNLYKQMLLLLFVAVPVAGPVTGPRTTRDLQWLATFVFSVPFILFSGYAGYLSDRYNKRLVIVLSKVAEIVIMAVGGLLFLMVSRIGMTPLTITCLCLALFCMGAQSAFFGPGKYGILPELLPDRHLPDANGFILMTTFLAIIFGTASAGSLMKYFHDRLWFAGVVCTLIAVAGTTTSLMIRRVPAASPRLRFEWSCVAIPREMRAYFAVDRPLLAAVIVSSVFWMAAAIVQMAVNALGKLQLKENSLRTSLMVASISVGIAAGSMIAAALSQQRFNTRVMKTGVWGLCACMILLALPAPNAHRHLLGYWGSLVTLVVAGGFTGMLAVPLQVFMQARPPDALKGRMIATQNLLNWIGITASAGLYGLSTRIIEMAGGPVCLVFAVTALLMLGIGLLYHPKEEPSAC